ncbi:hypothetical protein CC80DRAFT_21927 [Byssothecium circinans]|uniref:Uncharacterized protein n=1 Tax=Byssothecium circinans TaxID=147558 RepID=A0A6A5U2M0_9PLEO|nr:hypothetical protein CC80DRAFT_21927 [Byssothecium circinans]
MKFFPKFRRTENRVNGKPTVQASAESLPAPATQPSNQSKSKSKTWATTVTHVPSWPQEARPLKKHTWISYVYMIGDLILVLLPIYFILLGAAAITLNGKPTKDNALGEKVEFAIQLGPTLFPILFAAICGRSMKMIARFIAERRAKLSTLELLLASHSVWGTVESQFLMRRLTLVGANLLFLWALSPLGGQASLRLMKRGNRETYSETKLRYLTTGPAATAWGMASTYQLNGKFFDAGAIYTAALMAPLSTKLGPQDLWGNVKIPSLGVLNMSNVDSNGWITVPSNISTPETYSSLVGLPIVGLALNKTSTFTLESTYLSVECGAFQQYPLPQNGTISKWLDADWATLDQLVPGQVWKNKSADHPIGGTEGYSNSFFIDTNRPSSWGQDDNSDTQALVGRLDGFFGHYNRTRLTDQEARTRREITYASLYSISDDLSFYSLNVATCLLSQHHVEAMIRCNGNQCIATKVRESHSDHRPAALTGFENSQVMGNFAKQFPSAANIAYGSSPTEHLLVNSSSSPFIQRVGGSVPQKVMFADVSTIPTDLFSRRLSLLLNTYYQISMQPNGYWGGLSGNLTAYGPDTTPATEINVYLPSGLSATENSFYDWYSAFEQITQNITSPFIGATTTANVTSSQQIFNCEFPWLALLLTSSTIIFIIGTVALVLKRGTLGPELFGFVTSMSYENPYVQIPDGGSTLDAMERAKLLKDVEVCVGDVHGEKDVGHIAFAAGVPVRKLERGRLYA